MPRGPVPVRCWQDVVREYLLPGLVFLVMARYLLNTVRDFVRHHRELQAGGEGEEDAAPEAHDSGAEEAECTATNEAVVLGGPPPADAGGLRRRRPVAATPTPQPAAAEGPPTIPVEVDADSGRRQAMFRVLLVVFAALYLCKLRLGLTWMELFTFFFRRVIPSPVANDFLRMDGRLGDPAKLARA
eukprot:EG_transcript_22307